MSDSSTDVQSTEPGTAADTAETSSDAPIDADAIAPSAVDRTGEIELAVDGLVKRFGGITAVDGASFEVESGSITGLIGPNGAGKSTTFHCITGIHQPDEGSVAFQGQDITGIAPYECADYGLVRTFQIAREMANMTVLENLMLPARQQQGEALWRSVMPLARREVEEQERELLERVWDTLEFFEIEHIAEEKAGNLSGGQRKLLEMARALMTEPEMLLLDEPFAGVNPTLERKLLEHIHELRAEGYTFLIVEHDMDLIMEHCEHVIVMHQGSVLAEGAPGQVTSNEQVIEAYLGGEV
ncbi:ABC-type transport system ATP-binding protein (probable substrate branched-chain amino acids) [Natrialba magadii ATCC 43099]|uniref:Probable branched-chain amino acid transport ATP-binding protein LivG n=1 Tax=Natrialba magadii (strain ATCC 43099 / DSM 3394 / CCM 3739 / CIP 104546 / IAM 13178 / JCM 8861 / NBRC 102185 / NCIMB 2190 / MS3) TaxID=547559 RepID=D3SR84_NATMM|nr:ABC transporter ATP-binding protein [Natrialba magadii]ADD06640.1 ABC-type transport system ATP-binding protein (probable substrate branched-chain amino acids) [Natrialba magadii ATCC 43099]ELY31899.1 ABC transporter [Natrialba magadii ATCC 43099]